MNKPLCKIPKIVDLAKLNAYFDRFQDNVLWYSIVPAEDEDPFWVPVPVSDSGGGEFRSVMSGLNLMRWIRKEFARLNNEAALIETERQKWEAMRSMSHAPADCPERTKGGAHCGFCRELTGNSY